MTVVSPAVRRAVNPPAAALCRCIEQSFFSRLESRLVEGPTDETVADLLGAVAVLFGVVACW